MFANTQGEDGAYGSAVSVVYLDGDPTRATTLPVVGAMGVEAADLDGDGWLDLAFASVSDGASRHVDSPVFFGSDEGTWARTAALPTVGASHVVAADLDADGYPDLVYSNRYNGGDALDPASYEVPVAVYWGSPAGPDPHAVTEIPAMGAAQVDVTDLDGDGWLDLTVAHGTFHTGESWSWRGPAFAEADRVGFATFAPEGVASGDLDGDGHPDLVFANFYEFFAVDCASVLYLGGADGPDQGVDVEIDTHGATDAAISDLDGDGAAELVIANSMTGSLFAPDFTVPSVVFPGRSGGPDLEAGVALPTTSAAAVDVGDLDGDGWKDVAFANYYDADGRPATDSLVYLGGPDGFDATRALWFPTRAGADVQIVGPDPSVRAADQRVESAARSNRHASAAASGS